MMDYSLTIAHKKNYNSQTPNFGNGMTAGTAANPYSDFLARRRSLSTPTPVTTESKSSAYTQVNKFSTNVAKSKTQIIKGSLFSTPTYMPTMETVKNFGKALKGEGTDHSLSAINDPSIALGTLAIAGTLATLAKSPQSKIMEFVGAGTWLGSMVLWPKLVLAAHIKAMTGVDMNMEYVNDQGERKPFHRDAQYKPWDAVPEEMYDEMGKKLKVPENHPNRKAEIQRKADKVATGVNTWWMLSAGFSTPIMASVLANRVEDRLQKAIDATRVFSTDVRLQAAGYETGSNSILHRMGKAILKPFHNRRVKKEQAQIQQLHNLVEQGNYDKVAEIYKNYFGKNKNELKDTVLYKVSESIEGLRKNSGDTNAKDYLKGALGEAMSFARDKKLLSDYKKATLEYRWGTVRKFALRKIRRLLGIKGKTYKDLMKVSEADVTTAAETLAPAIKEASKKQGVKEKVNKIAKKAVDKVKHYGRVIDEITQKMGDKYDNSVIDNALYKQRLIKSRVANQYNIAGNEEKKVGEIAKRAAEKIIGIDNSFNFDPIFEQANNKNFHRYIAGIGNNDVWNGLSKKVTLPGNRRKILEKFYGTGESAKKTIDTFLKFFAEPDVQKKDSVRLTIENLRGESKAKMLLDTVKKEGNWFKYVGKVGLGSLAIATGTALWLIAHNGKKDAERRDA